MSSPVRLTGDLWALPSPGGYVSFRAGKGADSIARSCFDPAERKALLAYLSTPSLDEQIAQEVLPGLESPSTDLTAAAAALGHVLPDGHTWHCSGPLEPGYRVHTMRLACGPSPDQYIRDHVQSHEVEPSRSMWVVGSGPLTAPTLPEALCLLALEIVRNA